MLEFGVEVSTAELLALERVLRGLDTDEARSAIAKAHRAVGLTAKEREAVLSALGIVMRDAPTAPGDNWNGLATLTAQLEREQESEVEAAPPPRPRTTRK